MTTFQAVVFSIIHGFTEFLPVSSGAHQFLVPYLVGWPAPSGTFAGALALGTFLSILVYFRHDWASILSSFLQVIIFRKRPMTLDERMPIFLLISTLPTVGLWYYLHERVTAYSENPLFIAGTLVVFSLPLWLADSMSRRTKGMFDWNWLDALIIGLGQALLLLPGCGRAPGALSAGLFRNYNRESIAKYSFYAAAPILAATAFRHLHGIDFHAAAPMQDTTWFTWIITLIVTFAAGLLAIGGFLKHLQRRGFGQYIAYRCILAIGVAIVFFVRSRS